MTRCPARTGFVKGHKFVARTDEVPTAADPPVIRQIYVRDICQLCGEIRERMAAKECSETDHTFEPRYDEVNSTNERPGSLSIQSEKFTPAEMRTLLIRQIYVRDVCKKCGTTIERISS